MKKTLIALALMSIAGTAAAKNIEVQADVYSGKEFVKTYKAVVAEGASTEFKDKDVATRFESKPVPSTDAKTPSAAEQSAETGLSLKMTPRVLSSGKILIDAAYTLTTAGTAKVMHDGVEKEEPVTRIRSSGSQVVVNETAGKPGEFSSQLGPLVITFSAKEVL
ncbi:hypothetical protein [Pseudomonas baetica]|uniref:hypothetical protein n=1 Tax=Pseudomonas baetica TaxID=674054 RepID=UPI002406BF9D|nr:hypothetical protein [Pseudomonas baetica]MDF9778768.1 hypothetical protein [Pseudomonas baetica]